VTADLHDLDDIRLRRDIERVYELGPRAIFELLSEIGRECLLRVDIQRRVARYARLNPASLKAIEGRQ
jgi:hypothetical protein